jgi:nucleotide-binding universal stress UspA family protein
MKEKLVTLATDHYTAAEVLKARLEDAGIKVYLKHINLIQGAVSEGVSIQIGESDVEKALRIMSEWTYQQGEMDKKDMKSIRRILVPVDFSEYSRNACLYALNLASKYDADIKIVHVYYAPIVDLVPITDAYSIQIDMDINLRELETIAKKNLLSFVREIKTYARERGFGDIKIGYALREGIVEDEIARAAKEYKPGIIILGSKGKGEKQSDIIGSVVYRVLDRTRVPVLAIPDNSRFSSEKEVKNIVYATDFDDSDYVAIRRLISIVSAFHVQIHCIHVSKDLNKTWDKVRMDALKDYFGVVHKGLHVYCHLLEGDDLIKELEVFSETHKIDLFALTNRKRGIISRIFKPGLTKKLLYYSQIPLLIFRA